ncbi:PA14 domain-containing protein [Pontibacter silvestris]|uniref:PA14 domain-containing protein n=1 Tax=Pontibacter silvestris TaxID=2305183 RepID=A0ABW4X1T1_9BACT|nr:PA14 domain-containing protein [Pontibacter silvestris]MCC9135062.1 T9SS type A sorting domain-containing protein [Pontibacter silvestris]
MRKQLLAISLFLITIFNLNAQTRLGLHYTKEELSIWRQRASKGPYKSFGDAGRNSPGDWDRIKQNADAFLSKPNDEVWEGPEVNDGVHQPHQQGIKLRDAAFVYLITQDNKYSEAVRKVLLQTAAKRGNNIASWGYFGDTNGWISAEWLTRLLFAYDYIKETVPTTDRQTLDNWFRQSATAMANNVHSDLGKNFPNRLSGNYSVTGSVAKAGSMKSEYTHINANGSKGNRVSNLAIWYNNRRSQQILIAGLTGVFLNDANLKNHAKTYVKEWLKYSVYPDGTQGEYARNESGYPQKGANYTTVTLQAMAALADVMARTGDTELYNYSTSEGMHGTEGGKKSLRMAFETYLSQVDGSVKRYAISVKSNNIINHISKDKKLHWVKDIAAAVPNNYWKSSYIRGVYTRSGSGSVAYPGPGEKPSLASEGPIACPWGGTGAIYPGILFMFGQMDGKTWPYSGSYSDTPAANAAPTVSAGTDIAIQLPTNTAKLQGSAKDSDGSIASYSWSKVSGPTANLSGDNSAVLTASSLVEGEYVFKLTVKDNTGATASDEVALTVAAAELSIKSPSAGSTNSSNTQGNIIWEIWKNIKGEEISSIPLNKTPDETKTLTSFATPSNTENFYGSRIRGYITAPATGNYTFWAAGDNSVEVWLSTDESTSYSQQIISFKGYTEARQWDKYSEQKSKKVKLEAGKRYYVEVLHKEDWGGDHVALGWELPDGTKERPIAGNRLSAYSSEASTASTPTAAIQSASVTGSINWEVWKNVSGEKISSIPLTKSPDAVTALKSFSSPSNTGDNYGSRIRGYITAPATGNYTFWASGDNSVEVWLSTNESTSNKQQIIAFNGFTNAEQWDKYAGQKSNKIKLEAGKQYYVEVLHKESAGGDHVALGWQLADGTYERPIAGNRLSPYGTSNTLALTAEANSNLTADVEEATVYPNPFSDRIAIVLPEGTADVSAVNIKNQTGKEVYKMSQAMPTNQRIDIDLSYLNLQNGLYYLTLVYADGSQKVVKLIKQ